MAKHPEQIWPEPRTPGDCPEPTTPGDCQTSERVHAAKQRIKNGMLHSRARHLACRDAVAKLEREADTVNMGIRIALEAVAASEELKERTTTEAQKDKNEILHTMFQQHRTLRARKLLADHKLKQASQNTQDWVVYIQRVKQNVASQLAVAACNEKLRAFTHKRRRLDMNLDADAQRVIKHRRDACGWFDNDAKDA
jgi:hypothetical protein